MFVLRLLIFSMSPCDIFYGQIHPDNQCLKVYILLYLDEVAVRHCALVLCLM